MPQQIDDIDFGIDIVKSQTVSLPIPTADLMLLARTHKIRAIKAYRERHRVSLPQGKFAVEQALALGLEGKL